MGRTKRFAREVGVESASNSPRRQNAIAEKAWASAIAAWEWTRPGSRTPRASLLHHLHRYVVPHRRQEPADNALFYPRNT